MAEAVPGGEASQDIVGKGRPSITVEEDNLKYLLSLGFSKSAMTDILGISQKHCIIKFLLFPTQMISTALPNI